MGGLSRKLTAINDLRYHGKDPIILDAGDLLFTVPSVVDSNRASEIFRGSAMLDGFEKVGCDGFLSKFQPEELAELVQNRIRDRI